MHHCQDPSLTKKIGDFHDMKDDVMIESFKTISFSRSKSTNTLDVSFEMDYFYRPRDIYFIHLRLVTVITKILEPPICVRESQMKRFLSSKNVLRLKRKVFRNEVYQTHNK